MPSLAYNKRARTDYNLLETYEAGIVLTGPEVKAAKAGDARLQGAYITIARGELWLIGAHIGRYKPSGTLLNYDPSHTRKLLIRKSELRTLVGKTQEKGLTLVPIELYTSHQNIKVSFALARGKKLYDKRADIKKRELDRMARGLMKERR